MRVLITIPVNRYINPYIKTLYNGLISAGLDVKCSLTEFWDNWKQYDIIHIQWPHTLLVDRADATTQELEQVLQTIKKQGIKLVVTCHNFIPHYSNDLRLTESYRLAYGYADAIIHLGEYSQSIFISKYPKALNVAIPHHIYDGLFDNSALIDKRQAQRKLNISSKYKYVLCFGLFRDEEERILVGELSKKIKEKGYKILAPGFVRHKIHKKFWLSIREYMEYFKYKFRYPNVICNGLVINDEDIPLYYCASEIALIQRRQILNSGNLPMAMHMGKAVVGPNVGNVGQIINNTGNFAFNVDGESNIEECINNAIEQASIIGARNKEYALKYYSTTRVASMHIDLYRKLYEL